MKDRENRVNEEIIEIEYTEKKAETNKSSLVTSGDAKDGKFKKMASLLLAGTLMAGLGGGIGSYSTYRYLSDKGSFVGSADIEVNKSVARVPVVNTSSSDKLIPNIVERVSPAVVAVSTKSTESRYNPFVGYTNGEREGLGTGIIFNKEGYILTNHHVVKSVIENGGTVNIILNNGKETQAKIVNFDEQYDVAVLKITGEVEIPGVATFGSSDSLVPGEGVIAIGNPVGKELLGSVTAGIVSAINRDIDQRGIKFIQTDAAISPGNSGGPLVNTKGEVIGINTEKRVGEGVEGLGFAIPIDQIKPLLKELSTPALKIGIEGKVISPEVAKANGLPEGIYISRIFQLTAAERAGLRVGDIIVEMDGEKITSFDDISKIKKRSKAGDSINILVNRNGEKFKTKLIMASF